VNFYGGHDIVGYFCQVNQNIENQTTKTTDSHKLVWIESSLEEDFSLASTLDNSVIKSSGCNKFGNFTCLFPPNHDCDIWQPPDIS
jgi:hypothetical protein